MHDPSFDDHGAFAERQAEVVKGTEMEGELRLDLRAAIAQVEDRHRLIDSDFPGHHPGDVHALGIALFACHLITYRTLTRF